MVDQVKGYNDPKEKRPSHGGLKTIARDSCGLTQKNHNFPF